MDAVVAQWHKRVTVNLTVRCPIPTRGFNKAKRGDEFRHSNFRTTFSLAIELVIKREAIIFINIEAQLSRHLMLSCKIQYCVLSWYKEEMKTINFLNLDSNL